MKTGDLVDHSPSHPEAAPKIHGASNLVLIDNYDSFTWNVYQYLVLEGASVTVFRNDEITLEQLQARKPTQLVVSPGPGHPDSDGGISKEAIQYFAGKIPILGVCMGEQCIFSVFGGEVNNTGEILHGKTSPLRHDSRGLYAGLPQDLPVTRYHSLAGTRASLPECLEISSWISNGPDGGKGIIMGVRHKEYVVEGVQFHPESILSAEGRTMLSNFLKMSGGSWNTGVPQSLTNDDRDSSKMETSNESGGSILERIFTHRKIAVESQKLIPSQRHQDLQASYDMGLSPPAISFPRRLRDSLYPLALAAEIKRASPSKGDIAPFICAPAQARKYALAGASVISVLTEPKWFKGSIDDLRAVRRSIEGLPNRPAVLRKDFIFDEYQILEARLAGADTVLLIVKMLNWDLLKRLYIYSQSLGMEPLVEVNTVHEMSQALELGSQVIGVNNRNLTNFEVDLDTTSRLMTDVPNETSICALSGISGPADVEAYKKNGVGAVLVGEALMRHKDTAAFVRNLMGSSSPISTTPSTCKPLIKICGTRTPEAAEVAISSGADMIGIILVQGRKRCVSSTIAREISRTVHTTPKAMRNAAFKRTNDGSPEGHDYFEHTSQFFMRDDRALLVGVFQNQPLSYILAQQRDLGLDVVQLHGSEPVEWASLIPVPVIRRFSPGDAEIGVRGYHALPLLDAALGGTGERLDISSVKRQLASNPEVQIAFAGGLTPENVASIRSELQEFSSQIVAVDVSSGIEEEGEQDLRKIKNFIDAVRNDD